jgi:hypothetical protein
LKNYAKHLGLQGVEDEDENEQEMVPSFAKTYKALQKDKRFSVHRVEATQTVITF